MDVKKDVPLAMSGRCGGFFIKTVFLKGLTFLVRKNVH
jgi:hypothetical protein